MGVILLNTNETDNLLNEESGGYDNITLEWALQTPNLDLLESIDSYSAQNGQGDLLDSVIIAAQCLLVGFNAISLLAHCSGFHGNVSHKFHRYLVFFVFSFVPSLRI